MTNPYLPNPDLPQGYLPPLSAYQPIPAEGPDPNDPLINPPHSGINGWFGRISEMFKRSWKLMTAIFAITYLIPAIAIAVVMAVGLALTVLPWLTDLAEQTGSTTTPAPSFPELGPMLGVVLIGLFVAVLISVVVQMAGYGAATYAVTREAAGYQVRLGEALGYGFRRCLGLTGWQIVVYLLVILGAIACLLPGFYVFAATALFGPIYLFERRSPIGRSFSIFNSNLGRVLGRLAILLCAMIVGGCVNNIIGQITSSVAGSTGELSAIIGGAVVAGVIGLIIELPLTMLVFAGILLTYTEQRGYEGPDNARTLAAQL